MSVCEILSVGTEILLGDILNTNCRFLSRRMADMGISVLRHVTVGDNPGRLADAVSAALSRSDIVIATGGLGPTADDITKEICCRVFGEPLVFSEEEAELIRNYFSRKNSVMAESNLKQAYLPENGTVFPNPNGTASGIGMKKNGKALVILPGPPFEMEPMFDNYVVPFLKEYCSFVIVSHEIHTIGIGESTMAEMISDFMAQSNPTAAPYCKMGEAYIRITSKADSRENADALAKPIIDTICAKLGSYVYGVDCKSVEERVVPLLKKLSLTVATAESCTAGYVAKRITDIAGSSSVFKHGVITYANEVKEHALGVKRSTLETYGAVSEETAREMAAGIRAVSGADIGVSVTGFAGPGADEPGKDPGLIYVAIDTKDHSECEKIETGRNDREYNRYVSASRALNLVRKYAERKEVSN